MLTKKQDDVLSVCLTGIKEHFLRDFLETFVYIFSA